MVSLPSRPGEKIMDLLVPRGEALVKLVSLMFNRVTVQNPIDSAGADR